ncbi:MULTISPECIES: hypothetical protein [Enterobacter]|uniref:hypothetical protein n=1 Tax=Enterobacter TaxID=547 RepID=UPI000E2F5946|nr:MULTISPECIES: hypothetical protein [Enterobacter]
MKSALLATLATLLIASTSVYADPWKDESGNGRRYDYHGDSHKTVYRDGRCKVERKWEGNGEYKEERKCKGYSDHGHYDDSPSVIINTPDIVIKP